MLPLHLQQHGQHSQHSCADQGSILCFSCFSYRKEFCIVQEFYLFTKDMVHSGPDTFFKRVGTSAVLRTALIPGVTHLLQKVSKPDALSDSLMSQQVHLPS